jgi:hypothetical protein
LCVVSGGDAIPIVTNMDRTDQTRVNSSLR